MLGLIYKILKENVKMNTFIAMNRFKIAIGREGDFEEIWRNRESHLDDVGGFKKFNLLKGPTNEKYTCILLIVLGNLDLILKIGLNQKPLDWHIKTLGNIKNYI